MSSVANLKLKAHAKVNIGLQVRNKRPDGYHNIHTVFQELELHDVVILQKQSTGWNIEANAPNIPTDESNTCIKAYLLLKKHFPEIGGIKITLKKMIPSGAGLGGGSSDAAAVLKGLRVLYNLKISNDISAAHAAQIGADVPFFINGGTQVGDGIGEILTPLDKPIEGYYLLIVPDVFISTAWAYKSLKKYLKNDIDRPNFAHFFRENTFPKVIFDNDFEQILFPTYPEIGDIKRGLLIAGADYASLSGSGSTVFGIFNDEVLAKKAELQFQKQYRTFLTRPTNL